MNFAEYQAQAKQFAVYEEETYPFVGLPGEVGEFLDIPAKSLRGDNLLERFGSREAIREQVMKEAGDVLWMLTACLEELEMSLQDVAEMNIKKLKDRQERDVLKGSGDNR